jgi:hypothetical protein
MTSDFEIERITKRPIQYWFEDGLGELMTGSLFSIMGLFFLIQGWTPNSTIAYLVGILGMVAIGAGPWLSRYFLKKLKEKVIYPRTGYVKFPALKRTRRILTGVIALIVSSGLVFLASQYEDVLNWLPMIEGVAVGAMLYYQAMQVGLIRLYVEALSSILLGFGFSILGQGDLLGSGLYFLSFGVILIMGGGFTLIRYLRRSSQSDSLDEGESDERS